MSSNDILLEGGDPKNDPRAFRRTLGHYGTGVAVITAEGETHPVGVTVNSFASVSLDPPLVLWSAANTSTSLPAFRKAAGFTVNVLASHQTEISSRFAKSGGNKFAEIGHEIGRYGAPLLTGCAARLQCRRETEFPGGDHTILIGHVEHFARFTGTPLIFAQGRYGIPFDNPELDREIVPLNADARPYTFLTLLRRAYLARSAAFRQEAASAGLTVNESRVIYHLDANGRLDLAALASAALLDAASVEDAIRTLSARAMVCREDDGTFVNTEAGTALNSALRDVSAIAETDRLSGVSQETVEGARAVLEAFTRGP